MQFLAFFSIIDDTPATFWAVVKPLSNNQDGAFSLCAEADMMRMIDLVVFALLDRHGVGFDVEFLRTFLSL